MAPPLLPVSSCLLLLIALHHLLVQPCLQSKRREQAPDFLGTRGYARHRRFTITKLAVYKETVKKNQTTSYRGIQTTMAAQYLSDPRTSHGLANSGDSQLRLVLVGKTGAGKSATGNSILRKKVFLSSFSAVSITKHCEKGSSTWKGREVVVIDTPGLFDTEAPDAETLKEITRCMVLTSPGPHSLLLVIPLGRYTPEDQKATEKILTMFGERAREHMILLFTRKDDLEGMDFRDYLKQAPTAIQELIHKFRNRYCVFNNKATGAEQEDQREQLLALVQDVVNKCKGRYYTNSQYQKTEEEIQKQIQVLQEYYRAELERAKAQIKQEFEEEIRKLKDELEQQKRKVEMERQLAEREAYWVSRQQTARDDILSQNKILEIILNVLRGFSSLFKD
ncbi:hypothetical protein AB1E18_002906 [Capra hircus]